MQNVIIFSPKLSGMNIMTNHVKGSTTINHLSIVICKTRKIPLSVALVYQIRVVNLSRTLVRVAVLSKHIAKMTVSKTCI